MPSSHGHVINSAEDLFRPQSNGTPVPPDLEMEPGRFSAVELRGSEYRRIKWRCQCDRVIIAGAESEAASQKEPI